MSYHLWHVWVNSPDDLDYEDDPQFKMMDKFEKANPCVIETDYRGVQ